MAYAAESFAAVCTNTVNWVGSQLLPLLVGGKSLHVGEYFEAVGSISPVPMKQPVYGQSESVDVSWVTQTFASCQKQSASKQPTQQLPYNRNRLVESFAN